MKAYQRKRGEFLMGAALILFLIPTALLWLGTGTVCFASLFAAILSLLQQRQNKGGDLSMRSPPLLF